MQLHGYSHRLLSYAARAGERIQYQCGMNYRWWPGTCQRFFSSIPDEPFPSSLPDKPVADMSNEELQDNSTIPGWDLIHSPPRKFPRGALIGTVVSTKMQKTVNVSVDRYKIVPKIRKRIKYTKKFMAHDEEEVANMGDVVMITPCHRLSKHKHFMLREIIRPKGQLY